MRAHRTAMPSAPPLVRLLVAILFLASALLAVLGVTANGYTVYLPLVYRQPTPTHTATPTRTPTPSATPTATTPAPVPVRTPNVGDLFRQWGWDGSYQVWVNNLEFVCGQWICPDDDHNHRYNDSWVYVGSGVGTKTFTFPGEFVDVVVTYGWNMWAFDAFIGNTSEGYEVGYCYTEESEFSAPWADTGAFGYNTIGYYEDQGLPLPQPCGIAGPAPDDSWSITGYPPGHEQPGGILFRMLSLPWDELRETARRDGLSIGQYPYRLTGITIVAKPADQLTPLDAVCP